MAFGAGHQCQPSRLWALATRRPIGASGGGGSGGPLPGGNAGIARQARDAKIFLDLLVVRLQVFVGQRPIVGHAVERADAKVGRHVPLPVGGEDHAAAADGVVQDGRDIGIDVADRVIGRRLPPIGIGRPIAARGELVVGMAGPRLGIVGPIALLQDDDPHARFGQALGRHGAGRAGADDQHIGSAVVARHLCSLSNVAVTDAHTMSKLMMDATSSLPRYDRSQTYAGTTTTLRMSRRTYRLFRGDRARGRFAACRSPSPLGIAAGPLLNGRWILYYAALGFDVLTYKTTRSRGPRMLPAAEFAAGSMRPALSRSGTRADAIDEMQRKLGRFIRHAVDVAGCVAGRCRVDAERACRRRNCFPFRSSPAPSPIGRSTSWRTISPAAPAGRSKAARTASRRISRAPMSRRATAQLYQQPAAAAVVAQRVREAIGKTPYIIKVGFVGDDSLAGELLEAVAPYADALAMTNCITATVKQADGTELFAGQPRGHRGRRDPYGVYRASAPIRQARPPARPGDEDHRRGRSFHGSARREYLEAGAEAVHLATAVMVDPLVGVAIRRAM